MRFAPRILHFSISSGTTTLISSSESVIVWGLKINNNAAAFSIFQFQKADGSVVFTISLATAPPANNATVDIPFILDGGLAVNTTGVADITLFVSNVGA